jgi:hypothetical protein
MSADRAALVTPYSSLRRTDAGSFLPLASTRLWPDFSAA